MLAKRIVPCLDVNAGRVVKGVNFLNPKDAGDPVEVAEAYSRQGADEITFLDITASHEERPIILDVVARTAERVFVPLTVGGGIRAVEDIKALLRAGATVRAFDPKGLAEARKLLDGVTWCDDAYATMDGAAALVLVTEWNAFRGLDLERVKRLLAAPVVVDLRNMYDPGHMARAGFAYHCIGRPTA